MGIWVKVFTQKIYKPAKRFSVLNLDVVDERWKIFKDQEKKYSNLQTVSFNMNWKAFSYKAEMSLKK